MDYAQGATPGPGQARHGRPRAGYDCPSLLEDLSRRAADDALMDQAAAQMRHLRDSDPDAWADYTQEGQAWEEGTIERIDA